MTSAISDVEELKIGTRSTSNTVGYRGLASARGTGALGAHETADSIIQDVLNVVLPDDDESRDDHPWSWLAELARARGVDVTADDLRNLPYNVILTEGVTHWLGPLPS